jgi:hypothetical protein
MQRTFVTAGSYSMRGQAAATARVSQLTEGNTRTDTSTFDFSLTLRSP